MKKKVIIGAAVLLGIVMAALFILRTDREGDKGVLMASGNVEVTEVNVAFKIPGRVVALLSDEGKQVARGDKLAVLDRAEYASQVAQNNASLRNAEAQLEKAKKDLERYEILYKKDVIAAQQLDSARTGHDVALAQAQQAAAAVRMSEVRLGDTVIYSPAAGVVLRKNIEPGETVQAGVPIFSIGDISNPWIKVYVKEDKLGLVKLGQKAVITTDSYPDKTYEGIVTYISSEAEFTPRNVQTREERVKLVFGVKVSVKNQNDELKPGMPADVKILLK
ncbi:MAG TPA: efflux RND transporter periplasmic adaptor subunit [Nitrospirota bacterium]|nr:efflux RND transporter periplasmic adaptor subunit [Nitrospirota bacterium]